MQKTLFTYLILTIFCILNSYGQEEYHFEPGKGGNSEISGLHLGVNANFLFPTGGITGNTYSSGLGAGIFAKYILESRIGVGASANYDFLNFRGGAAPGITTSLRNINGLIEYYFGDGSTPFLGAEFGYYSLRTNYSTATSGTGNSVNTPSVSSFGFAPYLGYIFGLSEKIFLSGNIKYIRTLNSLIGVTPTQFIQLNLGLSYKL